VQVRARALSGIILFLFFNALSVAPGKPAAQVAVVHQQQRCRDLQTIA
jgi:hypothetical protein